MLPSLIEVKDASFSYPGQEVFKKLSFHVGKGEIFCIIGPNGCGKTSLLDCILGLQKVNKGEIIAGGRNIIHLHASEIARQMAYVPQLHDKTFPYRVLEIVLMGRASYTGIFASPSPEDFEIAEESLKKVGLDGLKERPYTQLSGGEVQLVMIARALTQKTPLIIMDEPTAHLDFKHELTVLETIVELVRDAEISVIMATHFPNHAFYFRNNGIRTRVALMNQAAFLAIGEPHEVLTEENLQRLYNIKAKVISCLVDDNKAIRQIVPVSTIR